MSKCKTLHTLRTEMKKTLILYLIPLFIILAAIIYFVFQFTAIYPPIKKFHYSKTFSNFNNELKFLTSKRTNISYSLTDTTGSEDNGYIYYFNINVISPGKNNEFTVAFKTEKSWNGDKKNTICLVGAFDMIHKVGGYSKESKGIDRLALAFEQDIYKQLKNTCP